MITEIHHIEKYVSNLDESLDFYHKKLGFLVAAIKKNDTQHSLLLVKGSALLQLTMPTDKNSDITQYLDEHGDGVQDVALRVNNVDKVFDQSVKQGAICIDQPQTIISNGKSIRFAKVRLYDCFNHSFWEFSDNLRLPYFEYVENIIEEQENYALSVDHVAFCFPQENLEKFVRFYHDAFSFNEIMNEEIQPASSGMSAIAMESRNSMVKFPMVSPLSSDSPLTTYLEYNRGGGIHHVAMHTNNIINIVEHLRNNAVQFRSAPQSYYNFLKDLYKDSDLPINIDKLESLEILLDSKNGGYLMQIFSLPVGEKPTFFLEFIQRIGKATGFGSGNVKALYKILEQEETKGQSG